MERRRLEVAVPWRAERRQGRQRNAPARGLPRSPALGRRQLGSGVGTGGRLPPPPPLPLPPPSAALFEHLRHLILLSHRPWQLYQSLLRGRAPLCARGVLALRVRLLCHLPFTCTVDTLGAWLRNSQLATTTLLTGGGNTR